MSKFQRIQSVILAVLMLLAAVLMISMPEIGYLIIILILAITLVVIGIRYIVYYFSMARFMVGGRTILFIGVIALDMGLFTATLYTVPKIYVVLYLVATNAISGVLGILRALEAKRYGAPSWRRNVTAGAVNLAIAVLSLVFIRSIRMIVIFYCIGLVYSAVTRIFTACRRTAIVYIQ